MTNELEKQFFDTFGIEPSGKKCTCDVKDFAKCTTYYCTSCEKALKKEYPQITDRILLELICILNDCGASYLSYRFKRNIDDLKNCILTDLMFSLIEETNANKEKLKHRVQALFEEGN